MRRVLPFLIAALFLTFAAPAFPARADSSTPTAAAAGPAAVAPAPATAAPAPAPDGAAAAAPADPKQVEGQVADAVKNHDWWLVVALGIFLVLLVIQRGTISLKSIPGGIGTAIGKFLFHTVAGETLIAFVGGVGAVLETVNLAGKIDHATWMSALQAGALAAAAILMKWMKSPGTPASQLGVHPPPGA